LTQHGKRYRDARSAIDREHLYSPLEAIRILKGANAAKFDETVEVHFHTGLNVRHADQQLRGTLMLPHGTGFAPAPTNPVTPGVFLTTVHASSDMSMLTST
jgi:large subunit ribosomal protein L1